MGVQISLDVITKPRPLAVIRNRRLNSVALLVPLRSVQFSQTDYAGFETCFGWDRVATHISNLDAALQPFRFIMCNGLAKQHLNCSQYYVRCTGPRGSDAVACTIFEFCSHWPETQPGSPIRHAGTHTRTHARTHAHTHIHTHIHTHTHTHIHTHTHT